MKPLALLANDDGHFSEGIRILREVLLQDFDVVLLAPETEQSAASHALSLHRPLRLKKLEPGIFTLDGTPADCVYVALHAGDRVLPRMPDVVVSGINRGLNLGQDAFYSGTVAAAREAALRGIPSLAASAEIGSDLSAVAKLSSTLATRLLNEKARERALVSLNVPKAWNNEVRAARLGKRHYEEELFFRTDPRGREYLWLGGPGVKHEDDPGSDTDLFDRGYATLTSLDLDLTSRDDGGLAALLSGETLRQ
ncbi:MAG: 5'/3'-nucleotidase SurE [Polyangiaceae bacterium]